ncbi:hypothetical protein ACET3Z_001444 [Daucus carota]
MKQLDEALEKMNMDASSAAASATGTSHAPQVSVSQRSTAMQKELPGLEYLEPEAGATDQQKQNIQEAKNQSSRASKKLRFLNILNCWSLPGFNMHPISLEFTSRNSSN